jgi:hypothetical protein
VLEKGKIVVDGPKEAVLQKLKGGKNSPVGSL